MQLHIGVFSRTFCCYIEGLLWYCFSSLRFRQDNALPCKRRLEFGECYLSKKSGAVQFLESLRDHLRKSNHYTVIDLSGFTESQIAEVDEYLQNLSPEELARVMRIGF